jgi:hypothetical protein
MLKRILVSAALTGLAVTGALSACGSAAQHSAAAGASASTPSAKATPAKPSSPGQSSSPAPASGAPVIFAVRLGPGFQPNTLRISPGQHVPRHHRPDRWRPADRALHLRRLLLHRAASRHRRADGHRATQLRPGQHLPAVDRRSHAQDHDPMTREDRSCLDRESRSVTIAVAAVTRDLPFWSRTDSQARQSNRARIGRYGTVRNVSPGPILAWP